MNNADAIVRLALSAKRGRIYATFGIDMSDLPPSILKDYVQLLAKKGNEFTKVLKAALGEEAAPAPAAPATPAGRSEWDSRPTY